MSSKEEKAQRLIDILQHMVKDIENSLRLSYQRKSYSVAMTASIIADTTVSIGEPVLAYIEALNKEIDSNDLESIKVFSHAIDVIERG